MGQHLWMRDFDPVYAGLMGVVPTLKEGELSAVRQTCSSKRPSLRLASLGDAPLGSILTGQNGRKATKGARPF
ncbi:hypothetical protein B5F12_03660 [Pseudoflavonifractor sp. An176]|nr:hypothetical protein B5F12_03660 [Pseudoflavonifractor sp. An176]